MRTLKFHLFWVTAASVAAFAGWTGCSSEGPAKFGEDTKDFGESDAAPEVGCTGLACSPDLRSIVDCEGKTIRTCSDDNACANGDCVPPCAAAAANEGSMGCSFAVPVNNSIGDGRGGCAAVFVANNWTSPATVRLEFDGKDLPLEGAVWVPSVVNGVVEHTKLEGPIPPGGSAVVFVSAEKTTANNRIDCPAFVTPALNKDYGVFGPGFTKVTLASTDVPVSMYSILPYGGAPSVFPSATLLFPTTSFRKNYIAVSSWGGLSDTFGIGVLPGSSGRVGGLTGKPTLQIVAVENDTTVAFRPSTDLVGGGGIEPTSRGGITNLKLQRGEMVQVMQVNDLTGSILESDKPVGLFGGNSKMFAPQDVCCADIDNEQIPPLSAWGHEYAVIPAPRRPQLETRGESKERDPSVVRIVGAADGTKLVYEPRRPPGSPDTLGLGQLAVFFVDDPFVVRSQDAEHPFHVSLVMTGAAASSAAQGDPETSMTVATDQWLDSYGFFTDFSYQLSSVFVTRRKVGGVFHDVTLDCAGALTGWTPISDEFEWTFVELTRHGEPQKYDAGTCTDGAHRITSEVPFALTVWGLAPYSSYAYPGGTGLRPRTNVYVPVH
ncbi:hypothetical protein AKJ09_00618 [Labilithrix luteola]|uniref:IgGFc-binding protein N-terminal domain-containing protein n=1 Tax=Labilithrix luteola TaxID=1391654 RepID=A0A0K1PLF8_9BACT|nr:IgGFc-binding protein [Labilithrix luteola]AKU93954.1 hypothetical protein AKJ09_00618 [Labilithrix luteola]